MHAAPQNPPPPSTMPPLPRVRSDALMAGSREIIILHDSQEYRLRITNAGKLILTK